MKRLVLLAALLGIPGCAHDNVVQVQVPVSAEPTPGSRIVVVYERGTNGGWNPIAQATPPTPLLPAPVPAVVLPVPPERESNCKVFVIPEFASTPPVPDTRKINEDQIDPVLYTYIGKLRAHIVTMKKDLRKAHEEYLKECKTEQ